MLEHLRHICARVDGLADDMREELSTATSAACTSLMRSRTPRIDRIKKRSARIERRLEVTE